ncbi:unnamed protein product [Phaedon cochleariae]|uniref:Ionotropic receptor n=1 Tax=Phaedon cochleariae TaxID=80249 RepID=A0A9N9SK10_PHACE|nr:unnamed protein product [Phaedon cochleariae]
MDNYWIGEDSATMRDITAHLKATPIFFEGERAEITQRIHNKSVDIIGTSRFVYKSDISSSFNSLSGDFIYSKHDDIVAVVPKVKRLPVIRSLLDIWDSGTWILLLSLLVAFPLALKILSYSYKKSKGTYLEYVLICWQIIMQSPTPTKFTSQPLIRLVLLAWIIFSVIFNTIITVKICDVILNPIFGNNIESLEELKATGYNIYGTKYSVKEIPRQYGLENQLRVITLKMIDIMVENKTTNVAYIMRRTSAQHYLSSQRNDPFYNIVDETLVPGILVYLIPKNSPFQTSLEMSVLLRKEYISNRETWISYQKEPQVISLGNLSGIFLLDTVGNVFAFIIFLLELILGKR